MGDNVGLILIAFVVLDSIRLVNPTSVTICFDLPKNTSTEVGCHETENRFKLRRDKLSTNHKQTVIIFTVLYLNLTHL